MEQSRKRVLIVGAAMFVVTLLLVVVILLSFVLRPATAVISGPFASNINSPVQIDDRTLYFFTGSAFATYDLDTYTTKDLTPFYAVPSEIGMVRIAKSGALAQISNYSAVDILNQTITDKDLDPGNTFWWVFDFNTKKPTLIGSPGSEASVNQALWQDDDSYVFDERLSDDSLRLMQAKIGQAPTQIAIISKDAELVWATKDTVLYLDKLQDGRQSLVQHNISDNKTTDLTPQYEVAGVLATGPDLSTVFIASIGKQQELNNDNGLSEPTEDDTPIGQLILYNGSSRQFTKLEDNFSGTASWPQTSNGWVVSGIKNGSQPVVLFSDNEDVRRLNTVLSSGREYLAVGRTSKGALVSNWYGELSYAGQSQVDGLPVVTNPVTTLGSHVFNDDFQMAYDTTYKQFNFYIQSRQNITAVDAALQYIRSKGIDPYQIKTKWYGSNGPDLSQ